jgi:F0F1-type ATP synthase assembly protein I
VSIIVFLYLGQWIDGKLGTDPWGMIIGVFTGAGTAFYSMYRRLMADLERDERARRKP